MKRYSLLTNKALSAMGASIAKIHCVAFVVAIATMVLFLSCFADLHRISSEPENIRLSAITLEGAEVGTTYAVVGTLFGGYPRYVSEYADSTNESILRIRTDGDGNGAYTFDPARVFGSLRGDAATFSVVALRGGIPDWERTISGKDLSLLTVWNSSDLPAVDPAAPAAADLTFTMSFSDFVPQKDRATTIVFVAD